jgi:hypothetical protein
MGGSTRLRRAARRGVSIAAGVGLLAGLLGLGTGAAAAEDGSYTCAGPLSLLSPGVLTGTHSDVRVSGLCAVNAGDATVKGDLTILPGGALVAAWGSSTLTVKGDVTVESGGALIMGCDPQSFSCIDDPHPNNPTLSSHASVSGDVRSEQPLGIIVHNATVGGDVHESGGGGGLSCDPAGVFALFQSPVYSAYEDSTVRGDVSVTGMTSCWMGLNRLDVRGDMRLINNQLADPDAIEILANTIRGDLVCKQNSMVWDNAEAGFPGLFPRTPPLTNTVKGQRVGQCVLSSPVNQGDPSGPGPF